MLENFDADKLEKIAVFINGDGFKALEMSWLILCKGYDRLSGITGDAFNNGKQVGTVYGISLILQRIKELRREIELMEKERAKNG
ncbi:MAG: hypothetical protein WC554_00985 [Clostridia bacterium]|jgi:hypothetical protein